MLGHDSWLEEASELDFPNFVVTSDTGGKCIYQGLVTILAFKAPTTVAVDFYTWERLRLRVQNSTLSQICIEKDGKPSVPHCLCIGSRSRSPQTPHSR